MKPRKRGRPRPKRKTQLDSFLAALHAHQVEELRAEDAREKRIVQSVREIVKEQESRILMASRSFDKVHDGHRDKHREIDERLDALEQGRTSAEGTMAEIRRTVEDLRSLVDPLRALLDRLKHQPEAHLGEGSAK